MSILEMLNSPLQPRWVLLTKYEELSKCISTGEIVKPKYGFFPDKREKDNKLHPSLS